MGYGVWGTGNAPWGGYRGKKVVVIGLARSGAAAANLLKDLGADVYVTDFSGSDKVRDLAEELKGRGIAVETGSHSRDFVRNKDLAVVSPGVSDRSPAVAWAAEFNIPLISEIELAWSLCPATIVAITGTNGKTTVTTLVARVLEAAGKKAFALGNIGRPFSQEVAGMKSGDFVSLEVSSFQLEKIIRFKPHVAAILNFTCDHLDRYKDMREYLEAKKRVFMNQDKDDYLVLNYDDPVLRGLASEGLSRAVFFGNARRPLSANYRLNHNHLAVMAIADIFGISAKVCLEVFGDFKGVEHRLEQVRIIRAVEFINDSKATNVDSTVWALENIQKPAVLIAGGRDKNSDYRLILDLVKEKVKSLVLIGEAREKIRSALTGVLPIREASSLEEAVAAAFAQAKGGDCVLLSPMCSSFDMFENYEHRGRMFKEIVGKLK